MDPITGLYQLWLEKAVADQDIQKELKTMAEEPDKLEDAFYQTLPSEPEVFGGSSGPEPTG